MKAFSILEKTYPEVQCPLDRSSPFRLLVATILSAQCTDRRVNIITSELFKKYNTPWQFARMPQKKLESLIRTAGLYRNKARNIRATARRICERFDGAVPGTMQDLCGLEGVGRKTANVVLSYAFGINEGFVVDTHVGRLGRRLKFTGSDDPAVVERDLLELTGEAKPKRGIYSLLFIYHGRRICLARGPKCSNCCIWPFCPSAGKV